MADKFVSERNLKFLLYEVFDAPSLTRHPYYADHSRESFDMALETAVKIREEPAETQAPGDGQDASEFVGGRVKVHPLVADVHEGMRGRGVDRGELLFDLRGTAASADRFAAAVHHCRRQITPRASTPCSPPARPISLSPSARRNRKTPICRRCSLGSGKERWP